MDANPMSSENKEGSIMFGDKSQVFKQTSDKQTVEESEAIEFIDPLIEKKRKLEAEKLL